MGGHGSGRKPTGTGAGRRSHHKKQNRLQTNPDAGVPEMPFELPKRARAQYQRLVPLLLKMKVLTEADGRALASYCIHRAQLEEVDAHIEKHGIIVRSKDGDRPNPAFRVKSHLLREMRVFENEFGLTPASRARLGIRLDDDTDRQLDDFLSGLDKTDETIQ